MAAPGAGLTLSALAVSRFGDRLFLVIRKVPALIVDQEPRLCSGDVRAQQPASMLIERAGLDPFLDAPVNILLAAREDVRQVAGEGLTRLFERLRFRRGLVFHRRGGLVAVDEPEWEDAQHAHQVKARSQRGAVERVSVEMIILSLLSRTWERPTPPAALPGTGGGNPGDRDAFATTLSSALA